MLLCKYGTGTAFRKHSDWDSSSQKQLKVPKGTEVLGGTAASHLMEDKVLRHLCLSRVLRVAYSLPNSLHVNPWSCLRLVVKLDLSSPALPVQADSSSPKASKTGGPGGWGGLFLDPCCPRPFEQEMLQSRSWDILHRGELPLSYGRMWSQSRIWVGRPVCWRSPLPTKRDVASIQTPQPPEIESCWERWMLQPSADQWGCKQHPVNLEG